MKLFRNIPLILLLLLAPSLSHASGDEPPQDRAEAIDALFSLYDREDVPGASVMVVQDGKVLFKKAYGSANLEDKIPSATTTNYRIASVSKQFTAMAIMILAERKKLSYDDSLTRFFPDFPAYGKQITVRHLLNHTSGLIDYAEVIPAGTTTPLTDSDVLDLMKRQDKTMFPPGSQFRYSNTGYAILALIVEAASGASFQEFMAKNIFKPLKMTNTVFYERDDHTDRRRAYGYTSRRDKFERTDQSLTSYILGDGAIYTSVEDYAKWDQALYTTKLVSAEALREAFTPGVAVDKETGYGFGWFISNRHDLKLLSHGGATIGFTTQVRRFPDKRLTVIIIANRNNAPLSGIIDKVIDLYLPKP
jgi:CubicO group peptidase (beta-lactamase class C family)